MIFLKADDINQCFLTGGPQEFFSGPPKFFNFVFFAQGMKNNSVKCFKSELCDTIKCCSLEWLNMKYDSSFNPSNFVKRIRGEESTSEM